MLCHLPSIHLACGCNLFVPLAVDVLSATMTGVTQKCGHVQQSLLQKVPPRPHFSYYL